MVAYICRKLKSFLYWEASESILRFCEGKSITVGVVVLIVH